VEFMQGSLTYTGRVSSVKGSCYIRSSALARGKTVSRSASRHKKACTRIALMLLIAAIAYSCGALVNAYGEEQLPEGADDRRVSAVRQAESPGSSGARMDMRTIDVIAGDTLWSIAQTYKPASQDTREYVLRLKKANGLKSPLLYEGQVLLLP